MVRRGGTFGGLCCCLLGVAALVAPTAAGATTKQQADAAAIAAIGSEDRGGQFVLFGLPEPLQSGSVVAQDGTPSRRIRLRAKTWFYWLDLVPGALFQHPSAVLLVDDVTGQVTRRIGFGWAPLIAGRRPAFLRSRRAYSADTYRVASSPAGVGPEPAAAAAAAAHRGRPLALPARNGPPKLDGECFITIGDRIDPNFKPGFDLVETTAKILKLPIEAATSLKDFKQKLKDLIKKNRCRDILIYLAGHGSPPPGFPNPGGSMGTSHQPTVVLKWKVPGKNGAPPEPKERPFTLDDLKRALKGLKAKFKLIVESCFGGRWTEASTFGNVVFVGTSSSSTQYSFSGTVTGKSYTPATQVNGRMVATGATITDQTLNPTGAGGFTNGFFRALLDWAASNRPNDDFYFGLRDAFSKSLKFNFGQQLGWTNPQVAGSAAQTGATSPPVTPPPVKGKTIVGTGGDNHINGTGGDDKINGGAGNDVIKGGAGNDRIDGGSGDDRIQGGAGNDRIIEKSFGRDHIDGGAGADLIKAGRGNDVVKGGAGNDVIYGGSGKDTVDCGPGADTVYVNIQSDKGRLKNCETVLEERKIASRTCEQGGTAASETVVGTPGNDRCDGGPGDDVISGEEGDDVCDGGAGNDIINGGSGHDRCDGGSGRDRIDCGSGDDTVVRRPGDTYANCEHFV